MILNETQYQIATEQKEKMEVALETDTAVDHIPQWTREAQRNAIRSQIEELRQEILEYDQLKSGTIKVTRVSRSSQLPLLLIKARISKGYTQKELAVRIGLDEQQIQRYEASVYKGLNVDFLVQVAKELYNSN
jgi:DNA-binding XRE family transcriptional regulator